MEKEMHTSSVPELFAVLFTVVLYKFSFFINIPMLQIHGSPILSELMIDSIRLIFTVMAAGLGYLFVHYLKVKITKEVKPKR